MTADNQEPVAARPCMLVVHNEPSQPGVLGRAFRRLGWDVYHARNGAEARRLARMLEPELLVMATDLEEESGWLTCEKLTRELPDVRVVLADAVPDARRAKLAAFVGAAALLPRDGLATLLECDPEPALPAAG